MILFLNLQLKTLNFVLMHYFYLNIKTRKEKRDSKEKIASSKTKRELLKKQILAQIMRKKRTKQK
jgi:hypothetical protein